MVLTVPQNFETFLHLDPDICEFFDDLNGGGTKG